MSSDERLQVWGAILAEIRGYFAEQGLVEVCTPVRVQANAVEPFIEPVPCGDQWLQTSPELWMKRLLGTRSIYQIAPCFRAGEHGPSHREGFHLIEWYRVQAELSQLQLDVDWLVQAASRAVGGVLGQEIVAPTRWCKVGWLDLFEETTGYALRGDEAATQLREPLTQLRAGRGLKDPTSEPQDAPTAQLFAWVELFSLWSDSALDPWLLRQPSTRGVHLVEFPAPLAALSRVQGARALRFESYWRATELANAYDELRDFAQQRARFERVNALRRSLGQDPLPLNEEFLEHLRLGAMPAAAGAAMGLERLVATVCERPDLAEVELCPVSPLKSRQDPGHRSVQRTVSAPDLGQ